MNLCSVLVLRFSPGEEDIPRAEQLANFDAAKPTYKLIDGAHGYAFLCSDVFSSQFPELLASRT